MPGRFAGVASEDLIRLAVAALHDIDGRRLFWVDLITGTRDGASADHIEWEDIDWDEVRSDVERWLDGLNPDDGPATVHWPVDDTVILVFRARPRTEMARGWPKPSLTLAETAIPAFYLADGTKKVLSDLSLEEVHLLANGETRVALELPSHRETFEMLAKELEGFGQTNTSELAPAFIEVYAGMLGLTETPPGLGDFDEGWRAINRKDFPIRDDPREDA